MKKTLKVKALFEALEGVLNHIESIMDYLNEELKSPWYNEDPERAKDLEARIEGYETVYNFLYSSVPNLVKEVQK